MPSSADCKPVLAGRNARGRRPPGRPSCDCPQRLLPTRNSAAQIAEHLQGIAAVLHCAGPFSQTARQMMDACLSAGADYLDITGEIDVIEWAAARGERAKQAGVALIPAVGFDVVPSDCLAAMLAERLPGAQVLAIGVRRRRRLQPRHGQDDGRGAARRRPRAHRRRDPPRAHRLEDDGDSLSPRNAVGHDDSLGRRGQRLLFDRHSQYRGLHGVPAQADCPAAAVAILAAAAGLETAASAGQALGRAKREGPLGPRARERAAHRCGVA